MSSSPPPPGQVETPYVPSSPFENAHPVEQPASSTTERMVYVACCVAGGVLASLVAAWLWIELADPPSARLTANGLDFGEESFDHVTAITLWFFVIGIGFGLVLGLVAALMGRRHGWVTVLAVLLMTWVGGSLTLWCGIHLFGPDHPIDFVALFNGTTEQRTAMLKDFGPGDELVSTVALSTPIALLGWPIGGMVGTLLGASVWPTATKAPRQDVQMSPSVPPR
jgi:hypothetical protein